jgi:PAS domain S-box-containing protein
MHALEQLQIDPADTASGQIQDREHLDFPPEACVFTNLSFQIRNVNIAGLHLFGETPAFLERTPFFQFISLSDRHAVVALSAALLRDGEDGAESIEITVIPPRRIEVTCAATVTLMRDSTGTPVGFMWLMRDVAAPMKEDESLELSQRMEGLSRVARSLVHEFSNILTGIRLNADIIGIARSTRDRRESLDEIRNGCDRAVDILRKFRAITSSPDFEPHRSLAERGRD